MSKLLTERLKLDLAKIDGALATPAGVTSDYLSLANYKRIVFEFALDTMATGETVVATALEAQDAAGTSSAALSGATCTVTAHSNVQGATVTAASVQVGDTVTLGGLTFTAAAAEDKTAREFDQSGNDTACGASLAACINDASYGVSGVTASAASGVVTLAPTVPGGAVFTVASSNDTRLAVVTTEALGYIEVEDTALSAGFDHVALKLVGPATVYGTVLAIRGDASYIPAQFVAASDTDS